MTDEKLLFLCQQYGERARFFRQKFLGLLPEVYKRKLYLKKGCSSVYEFAAKLAGISEEQVSRVLNLERKFQDKPDLHRALVNGEVSVNKLIRVTSIATQENQKILLEQIKILPNRAIETFVRDEKRMHVHKLDEKMSILQLLTPEPELSNEVKQKLYELQQKGIDINALILEAIQEHNLEITEEKEKITAEQGYARNKKTSRYIPAKINQLIQQEYGTKCAVPNCQRDAEQIHHEIPFALLKNHNPNFLKPLCKEHHVRTHAAWLSPLNFPAECASVLNTLFCFNLSQN